MVRGAVHRCWGRKLEASLKDPNRQLHYNKWVASMRVQRRVGKIRLVDTPSVVICREERGGEAGIGEANGPQKTGHNPL